MRSHRITRFSMFCAACLGGATYFGGAGLAHAAIINGADFAGGDLAPSNGDVLNGTFTNVGTFTVAPGTTVFVDPGTLLSVFADRIVIDGTLNGDGAGFAGGVDGHNGSAGTGLGGGQGGSFGLNVHASGGGGGGYGGPGGNGAWLNVGGTTQAQGGPTYGTAAPPGVQLGSGGGGAGDHTGAGAGFPGTGGDGGAGGAGIMLDASVSLDLVGVITAEGANGQQGNLNGDSFSVSGGGGGSGGGIELDGGLLNLSGSLNAAGGNGGNYSGPLGGFGHGGGGGGGGRIKLTGQAIYNPGFTVDVLGGIGGISDANTTGQALPGGIGTFADATTAPNSVPEPGSLPMIGFGAAGLLAWRRRMQSSPARLRNVAGN